MHLGVRCKSGGCPALHMTGAVHLPAQTTGHVSEWSAIHPEWKQFLPSLCCGGVPNHPPPTSTPSQVKEARIWSDLWLLCITLSHVCSVAKASKTTDLGFATGEEQTVGVVQLHLLQGLHGRIVISPRHPRAHQDVNDLLQAAGAVIHVVLSPMADKVWECVNVVQTRSGCRCGHPCSAQPYGGQSEEMCERGAKKSRLPVRSSMKCMWDALSPGYVCTGVDTLMKDLDESVAATLCTF